MAKDAVGEVPGMSDAGADRLAAVIDRNDEDEARLQIAKSDPAYASAFLKTIANTGLSVELTDHENQAIRTVNQIRNAMSIAMRSTFAKFSSSSAFDM